MQALSRIPAFLPPLSILLACMLAGNVEAQTVKDIQLDTPIATGTSTITPVVGGREVSILGAGTTTKYRLNGGEWIPVANGDLAMIDVGNGDVLEISGPGGTWHITGALPPPA